MTLKFSSSHVALMSALAIEPLAFLSNLLRELSVWPLGLPKLLTSVYPYRGKGRDGNKGQGQNRT